jgi:hypothetical protein
MKERLRDSVVTTGPRKSDEMSLKRRRHCTVMQAESPGRHIKDDQRFWSVRPYLLHSRKARHTLAFSTCSALLLPFLIMTTFDTIFPADSLEFCPITDFQSIFVCGTYKLEDQTTQRAENEANTTEELEAQPKLPQRRKGQCLTFKLLGSSPNPSL